MTPLLSRLQLRSSLYQEPDGLLDVAMLQCQQAADANDAGVSITLMRNVVKHLTAAASASPTLTLVTSPANPWVDGSAPALSPLVCVWIYFISPPCFVFLVSVVI